MKKWSKRSPEVAYLLNPPFCALIIYNAITSYQNERKQAFPFTLQYLLLPIILHSNTRKKIQPRSHMSVWLQSNQNLLTDFAKRAKSLIPITNEAIIFLLQSNLVTINKDKLTIQKKISSSKFKNQSDKEVQECFIKAQTVGKWFAKNGTVENIYQSWGVRP